MFFGGSFSRTAGDPEKQQQGDLHKRFEESYEAWKAHCESVRMCSDMAVRLDSPHYRNIIKMGPRVLPLVVDKCLHDDDEFAPPIGHAWVELTKVWPVPGVNPWAETRLQTWLEGGEELATERFGMLYRSLEEKESSGLSEEANKLRKSIRSLGLLALPAMMTRLEDGDEQVQPMIKNLVGEEMGSATDRDAILLWWEENKNVYSVLPKRCSK